MEYKLQRRENCDKSLKVGDVQVLLYSAKKFSEISAGGKVVGEVILSDKKEPCSGDDTVKLGKRLLAVKKPGEGNRLIHKVDGYVAVGTDAYIQVRQSRIPFLLTLIGMLFTALVLMVVILAITGSALPGSGSDPVNALPVIDPYILRDEKLNIAKPRRDANGGGSIDIDFKPSATLKLSTGDIAIEYANPAASTHDTLIELYVVSDQGGESREYLIAKSGRIPTGSKLATMTLIPEMKGLFGGEGVYMAMYRVLFYDPQTGELALVNNQLTGISLTVIR